MGVVSKKCMVGHLPHQIINPSYSPGHYQLFRARARPQFLSKSGLHHGASLSKTLTIPFSTKHHWEKRYCPEDGHPCLNWQLAVSCVLPHNYLHCVNAKYTMDSVSVIP